MYRALVDAGADIRFIQVRKKGTRLIHIVRKLSSMLVGKSYIHHYERDVLDAIGKSVAARLPKDTEAIFAPTTHLVAALAPYTRIPLYFYVDATLAGMTGFYDSFTRISEYSLKQGHRVEQLAIDSCRRGFFRSNWAAQTAIQRYRMDPGKSIVVHGGANLTTTPETEAAIQRKMDAPIGGSLNLLFIGKDWQRKGGEKVIETFRILRSLHKESSLTIIGYKKGATEMPEGVEYLGYLDKRDSVDAKRIKVQLLKADFLIMLPQAEALGLVYIEACALGAIPVGNNVGGTSDVVRNDVSGLLCELEDSPEKIARRILELYEDQEKFRAMRRNARNLYLEIFNWKTIGRTMLGEMEHATFARGNE
jgi:glycosyltransferase involved in cell wall biosynthesis